MLFKPPKVHYHTAKLLILGVLLCIFTAGSAMADPPADKPCKGSKCPPPSLEAPDNYVFWGFDELLSHFYEHGSRSCEVTQLAADFSSGTYDCALNGDFVSYGFSATPATQIYTKGNDWYCQDTLGGGYDDLEEIPDLQYSYSWTGNCKSPLTCDVTIVNRMSMNTSMYSAITIEAFAEGTTDDPDGNPFAEDQDLIINRLLVTKFAPKGKAKVLAICEAFPAVGTVTFHTSLDPVTPQ